MERLMGIKIGNDNKIKDSTIAENSVVVTTGQKKNWAERHPIVIGLIIALVSGFILSFSFWDKIKNFIEAWGK